MESLRISAPGPIYIETSGLIYSVEHIEPYYSLLEPVWESARMGQLVVVSSELSVLETLVKPLRERNSTLKRVFMDMFDSDDVQLIPTTRAVWEDAALLRATAGLHTPDALHAAAAMHANCTAFITNDGDFRMVDDLPVVVLDDHIEDRSVVV